MEGREQRRHRAGAAQRTEFSLNSDGKPLDSFFLSFFVFSHA